MAEATSTPETPMSLATLTGGIKSWIDNLGVAWVEAEITQWSEKAGNIYGTLKDLSVEARMEFAIWKSVAGSLNDDYKVGDRVVMQVKVDFWPNNGRIRLNILAMKRAGLGDLLEKLEALKAKLRAEGLFDESRKVALPFLPNRIGLITGKDSDAEKDVIKNARLRWPQVEFELRHTRVQGAQTTPEVIAAIADLDANPEVDVIIIARGGGDFLDLHVFSDEALVRAAAACETPIVSAIGHEADNPLLDYVADLRASTPTDAAKRVVPDVGEELARVSESRGRIRLQANTFVSSEWEKLAQMRTRPALAGSEWIIDNRADELVRLIQRGTELIDRALSDASTDVASLRTHLRALSPQSTLDRGYAIAVRADGTVARTVKDAPSGTDLTITLVDGRIGAVSSGPKK
jgi:exodeoxyribonuclease VII large subunit